MATVYDDACEVMEMGQARLQLLECLPTCTETGQRQREGTKSTATTCWVLDVPYVPAAVRAREALLVQVGAGWRWLAVSGMFCSRFAAAQPVPSREGLAPKRAFLTIIAAQRHDSSALEHSTLPLAEG
jgi:hypothetical protein